jgi:methylmalonyl-CoA/ethylmalonyl-CoA epimerase
MVIDHIGIVVRRLQDGVSQWSGLFGYHQNSVVVTNVRQKVRVTFLWKKDSLTIKLVEPLDPTSPVYAFARKGGGLHHVCFRCNSLSEAVPVLKEKGARFIVPPEPGEAVENNNIAFFLAENNLLIELIDTVQKTGWLAES